MIGGVYIAYPIDQRDHGGDDLHILFQQIETLKVLLLGGGLVNWVFDPGDAFSVRPDAPVDDNLPAINRAALVHSDLVVAFLPRGVPTIGVPMEIDRARALGKHVIVISDVGESYMLAMSRVAQFPGWDDHTLGSVVEYVGTLDPPVAEPQFRELPFTVSGFGELPKRAYDDDAGLDLMCSERVILSPGEFVDVPCGLAVELPPSHWGWVTGRSSALRKKGLLVHTGVIDPGYRGPLFAGAFNLTQEDVLVERGERIAQLIVMPNATRGFYPIQAEALTSSARGKRGFGSTGA